MGLITFALGLRTIFKDGYCDREAIFPSGRIGRSIKKLRQRSTEPPDPDDLVVNDKGIKVNTNNVTTKLWKDKLLGNTTTSMNTQKEEDFELLQWDAKKEIVDGIPSIPFSE
ncbi:hypothetical protein PVK06_025013 [Gossypium arboreum]|uniref:Uncharacterized protein n=1 Tax=Gossypium arboreum TaxID=29729 RepID=A0ABR0PFH7_GOSAR|nr:hypothetical protein PVK06_025013 [Gossypium arboreum]